MTGTYYPNSVLVGKKNQPDSFWRVRLDYIPDDSNNQKAHSHALMI